MLKYILGFLLKIVKLKVIVLYKCLVISSKCSPASSRLTSFVPCPPLATSNAIHLFQFSVPTPPAHFFTFVRLGSEDFAIGGSRGSKLHCIYLRRYWIQYVFIVSSNTTITLFNIYIHFSYFVTKVQSAKYSMQHTLTYFLTTYGAYFTLKWGLLL